MPARTTNVWSAVLFEFKSRQCADHTTRTRAKGYLSRCPAAANTAIMPPSAATAVPTATTPFGAPATGDAPLVPPLKPAPSVCSSPGVCVGGGEATPEPLSLQLKAAAEEPGGGAVERSAELASLGITSSKL